MLITVKNVALFLILNVLINAVNSNTVVKLNNFIVSKAMVINTRSLEINLTTGQISARFIGGFRGTLPDIFYAANSSSIDKQVSWSMSNSLHYGRNIQLNGYFRTHSGQLSATILCTMAVVLE